MVTAYWDRISNARRALQLSLPVLFFLATLTSGAFAQTQVLFGDQTVESEHDSNTAGTAEAFQTTATSTGTLGAIEFYIDANSVATSVNVGLYADNAGNPGTLLSSGTLSSPPTGWNSLTVPAVNIVSGTPYWIAVLGIDATVRFRDRPSGPCTSQTSKSTTLTALPSKWTTGTKYTDCPLSSYGTGTSAPQPPMLSLSTQTISLAALVGGSAIATTASVLNSGGGTLDFQTSSDSAWLTVTPQSGTAPAQLSITANPSGLGAGVYNGNATVSSTEAQNSPLTIAVTLNITTAPPPTEPGDWLTIEHDPARLGFASDETTLSTSNAADLTLQWTATVDGAVTAQPLFVGAIPINGQTHDVVIAATSGNSIYALDAAAGTFLWKTNLGTPQTANCVYSQGFGVSGAPVIDRARLRVYAVSSQGSFYSLSLLDGTITGEIAGMIVNPATNNVWGGLNQNGNYVYLATGSDGCDDKPWAGETYQIDVSGSAPVVVNTALVVPGGGSAAGGGIWGYGGVSIDTANGNVYAAASADVTAADNGSAGDSGYANHMSAYTSSLTVLGSYAPTDPSTYPCSSSPCDLDFASTPLIFQPASCPQLALAGKKNGNLYLFRTADLIASLPPLQILQINGPNDSLGSGGVGGTASYWPQGNMVYIGTAGAGANGVAGGIVALSVNTTSCTLTPAWSHALGGSDNPNSTVTIANGVALIGVGLDGTVHAYDAASGAALWTSAAYGSTFAAPTVAKGSVYYGSWSSTGTNAGRITAYSLTGVPPPPSPVLSVAPLTLSFTESQGGSLPASKTVSVTNTGTGTLSYTAQSDSTWLAVTPASGNAPGTLTASVSALTAGTYTGHITVTASGASQSPQTVTVTLTVSAPPPPNPVLSLSNISLSFTEAQGGAIPAAQTVTVSNTGGGTLSFTTQSDSTWLTVTPASGNAPASLTVAVSAETAGTYTGHVTVTAPGANSSPQTITVSLNVTPPQTGTLLLGTQTLGTEHDANSSGQAEAFQATAIATGNIGTIFFYLDSNSTAATATIGIYSDMSGTPGTLLGQSTTGAPQAGAWNSLSFPAQPLTSGTKYWMAILGSGAGTIHFRDHPNGSCTSETSAQKNLVTLPTVWTAGTKYTDCPLSAYVLSQ
jgi:hypothetical protein